MTEIYVSVDVETNGPIPGVYSMLSLGAAAYTGASATPLSTFSINVEKLPGAKEDPDTMNWWAQHPAAWVAANKDPIPPADAMRAHASWLKVLGGKPLFVAYPASFDYMFVHWYFIRFLGEDPYGLEALDIRSYAMGMFGTHFEVTSKRNLPSAWMPKRPLQHIPLEDALDQGELFCAMLEARRKQG